LRDTSFRGVRNYISGFDGSQAVLTLLLVVAKHVIKINFVHDVGRSAL
jgi:hypothetical protein